MNEILLRSSQVEYEPNTSVIEIRSGSFKQENRASISGVQVVEITSDEESKPSQYFCFVRVSTSVILIKEVTDSGKISKCLEISAEHDVVVESSEIPSEQYINEIGNNEGFVYDVWPYWKELVSSLSSKMGISTPKIPNFNGFTETVKLEKIDI